MTKKKKTTTTTKTRVKKIHDYSKFDCDKKVSGLHARNTNVSSWNTVTWFAMESKGVSGYRLRRDFKGEHGFGYPSEPGPKQEDTGC